MKCWIIVVISLLLISCSSGKSYKTTGFTKQLEEEETFHFTAEMKSFSGEYQEKINLKNSSKLNLEIMCEDGELLFSLLDDKNNVVYVKKSSNLSISEELIIPEGQYSLVWSGEKLKNTSITVSTN